MATKLLVCLIMVAAAIAVPLRYGETEFEEYECAKTCQEFERSNFKYTTSETYVYEYVAEADTLVAGASEQTARMKITTLANIEVLNTCEFALRLQDVSVYHSDPYSTSLKLAERSQEFQTALTENTLRFAFDDGIIRHICTRVEEKPWVLNFKRGLLSAFQVSMKNHRKQDQNITETDVSGECKARFIRKSDWSWYSSDSHHFQKTKNLLACSQHSSLRSVLPMVPYHAPSDIQSLPIMRSSQTCDIKVKDSKILESTTCTESHVFAPFSNQQSGGATNIKQTLTFKTVKSGVETRQDMISRRSKLIFEHSHGIEGVSNSKQAAEQKLKEICEQTKNNVRSETPRLFTELAQIVKVLDIMDLKDLYRMIEKGRLCSQNNKAMKYLLDTLPIAGTPASIEMMTTILEKNEISDLEQQVWLTSLSLIREPTDELIPSLVKLLNSKLGEQALLPVSALMNTVCKKYGDCENNYFFSELTDFINSRIDSYCSDDISKILWTLRAIGNIGYGSSLKRSLKQCVTSRYSPIEVKVVALDAYRRFPCEESEAEPTLWQVYESGRQDSELRIMSFLALMQCPSKPTVGRIVTQLGIETDDNVGSFVSSHLESIKKSSDPLKQDTAVMLKRHFYIRKYPGAGIQSSKTFESSALLNRVNLGYVADSDLIFSGPSMVPRQMNLNLTVQLFGHSVNLFEIGARMNGLEKFVEKYFGPQGYFSAPETSPEDLQGFVYARFFGNELLFKQIKGSEEVEKIKSQLNLDKLLDILSKQFNYKYSHSQQLFDESMIIPTVIGLPINLTVNSSVTVNADIDGNIDLAGIFSRSKPITVSSKIAASAGLEITGSMMVDAMLYKQGVRMRNTLQSSVNFKPSLVIQQRQILSFELEAPPEKQELFDARSQFFIIHDSLEKEQQMISRREDFKSCTGEKFAAITGMEFCADVSFPNATEIEGAPFFPLTGPARARIALNKKDKHGSYNIFAKWIKNSKKLEAQLQVNTPGSEIDRHISTDITVGVHKHPHVDIVLLSPWKKFILNSKAAMNDDIASLTGSVTIDESEYKLTSELKMSKKGKQQQYLPFIEVKDKDETYTLLTGKVVHNLKNDITADLEIKDLKQDAYFVDSQLFYSPKRKGLTLKGGRKGWKNPCELRVGSTFNLSGKKNEIWSIQPELFIRSPKETLIDLSSQGQYKAEPLLVSGQMSLQVAGIKKSFVLKGDVSKKGKKYPVNAKLNIPGVQGSIRGDVNVMKFAYKSQMTVTYNAGKMKDTIRWNGKFHDKKSKHTISSNLRLKNNPDYNNQWNIDFTHKKNRPHVVQIVTYYGKKAKNVNKMVKVDASLKSNIDFSKLTKGEVTADLKVKVPEKKVDMKVNLNHQHSKRKLNSDIMLDLKPFYEKPIKADILLENKGFKMYNIHGHGNFETEGNTYRIDSDVIQHNKYRSDQLISFSTNNEKKHEISAVLKSGENFKYSIDLTSEKIKKPLSLVLSGTAKNPSDFSIKLALAEDKKESYFVEGITKMNLDKSGKWTLVAAHPERKVRLSARFNRMNDKTSINGVFNWDDDSKQKPKPQVQITGSVTHSDKSESITLKSELEIETPFKNVESIKSRMMFEKKDQIEASFALGKNLRRNVYFDVKGKYQNLNHFSLDAKVSPPWKQAVKYNVELNHQLDEEAFALKAIFAKDRAKTGYNVDLKMNDQSFSSDILLLLSPAYEHDITMKTNVQFENYPTTVSNKLRWAPHSNIDLTGSLKAEAVDDLELSLKLSSPSSVMSSVSLVASNTRQRSLTVSHLNIDYDLKRVIDIELSHKITEPKKVMRLKVQTPDFPVQRLEAGVKLDLTKDVVTHGDVELVFDSKNKYEGEVSLRINRNKNINGNFEIKTPVDEYTLIEGTFTRTNKKNKQINVMTLKKEKKQLIQVSTTIQGKPNSFNIQVESEGKIVEMLAEAYDDIDKSNVKALLPILPTKLYKHKGQALQEVAMRLEIEDKNKLQIDGSLTRGYGKKKVVNSFKLNKAGKALNDMAIDLKLSQDKDVTEVNIVCKTVDKINLKALVTFGTKERVGFEFQHESTSQGLKLIGGLYFFETTKPVLHVDLFMTDIERIELTAEYLVGYKETNKLTYTHNGQDNRISCSANIITDTRTITLFELIAQKSPIQTLSIKTSTPFTILSEISLSANYDETNMNGLLTINENDLLTLTGSHNQLENLKITLKTALKELPSISINNDGSLTDGNVQFTIEFDEGKKMSGSFVIKYVNPLDMKIDGSFSSNKFVSIEDVTIGFGIKDDPRRNLRLELALDNDNKIAYNVNEEYGNSKVTLDAYYKDLNLETDRLMITSTGNNEKITSTGYFMSGSEKVFDADVTVENMMEKKVTIVVRKPNPMEYTISQGYDKNELELQWDKSNPNAKVTIQTSILDNSYSGKTDKSVKVLVICPTRTLTVEHAITASNVQYLSNGKFSWSNDWDSQVSYNLELNDLSNRVQNHYKGELKLKLPSRTFGVEGYAKDRTEAREGQATFYWDWDRYPSNKVGLKGVLSQTPIKRADITLILPKEAHIDNKLVWDNGNTIIEGQTDIHYSSDESKTLTLFTKVQNTVATGYSGYLYSIPNQNSYNYSIEFGVHHPESRVDIKMMSHIGADDDKMTSSLGLDYLSSRRQKKNFDLFLEINNLKKEINLVANNPYKSFGFYSHLMRQDPLELEAGITVDHEDRRKIHIVSKPDSRRVDIHFSKLDHEFVYSASYPNKTSILFERGQKISGYVEPEYSVLLRLASPNILQGTLNWKQGLLKDTRDRFFEELEVVIRDLKDSADGIIQDFEKEIVEKYKDISGTIVEDMRYLVEAMEEELAYIQTDTESWEQTLKQNIDFCPVVIGKHDLTDIFNSWKKRLSIRSLNANIKDIRISLQSLSSQLQEIQYTAINERYEDIVQDIGKLEKDVIGTEFWNFLRMLNGIDRQDFEEGWQKLYEIVDKEMDPKPAVDKINAYFHDLKDMKVYLDLAKEYISESEWMERLKTMWNNLKEENKVVQDVNELGKLDTEGIVYLSSSAEMITGIIEDELEEHINPIMRVLSNPITVFDPQRGIMQVEVPLILSFDRLDKMPTSEQMFDKVVDFASFR